MGPRADPTPSSGFVLPEMRIHVNNYSVEGCLNMLLFPNLFLDCKTFNSLERQV